MVKAEGRDRPVVWIIHNNLSFVKFWKYQQGCLMSSFPEFNNVSGMVYIWTASTSGKVLATSTIRSLTWERNGRVACGVVFVKTGQECHVCLLRSLTSKRGIDECSIDQANCVLRLDPTHVSITLWERGQRDVIYLTVCDSVTGPLIVGA